jgi:ribosomal protein L2
MAVVRVAPRVAVPGHALGQATKGKRTRDKNKASQKLIIRSRHAKKKGR